MTESAPLQLHILIMEDDPDLLALFSRTLQRQGYVVQEAATIDAARQVLANEPVDLFLCDIQLGEERATTLLAQQAPLLIARGTQLVAMSAESHYRDICEAYGVDFYLEKPVVPEMLVRLIDRLLHSRSNL